MANTEQNTGQSIVLQSFEETVVAYGAVQEVWGEHEPLLQPTTPIYGEGHSLHDELYRPEGRSPAEFKDADRRTILGALWLVAKPESGSRHQKVAERMLSEHALMGDAAQAAEVESTQHAAADEASVSLKAARTVVANKQKRRRETVHMMPRIIAAAALKFV